MKAVVLEIKEKWAAVLCEDGVIRKVKKGNFKVGDSFDFEAESQLAHGPAKSIQESDSA